MNVPINQLKRPELLKLCRSHDLHNYSRLPKKDLIRLLSAEPSPPAEPSPSAEHSQPVAEPRFLTIASAIIRHYYMYPILTSALFKSLTASKIEQFTTIV